MKLSPQQKALLARLSQVEDTAEASALIEAFLSESKETAPDRRPSTVQELFCDLLSGESYTDAEIRDFLVRHGGYAAEIYVPVVFTELPNDGDRAEIEQMLATIPKSIWFLYQGRFVLLTEFSHTAFPTDQLSGLLKAQDLRAAAGRPRSPSMRARAAAASCASRRSGSASTTGARISGRSVGSGRKPPP